MRMMAETKSAVKRTLLPQNISLPVIFGAQPVGSTFVSTNGVWSGNPTGFNYQWQADLVNIPGATGNSYVSTIGDDGKVITLVVTPVGGGLPARSNGILVQAGTIPVPTVGDPGGGVFNAAAPPNAISYTTTSFTPPANSFIVVCLGSYRTGGLTAAKPRITDSSGAVYSELVANNTSNQTTVSYNQVMVISENTGPSPAARTLKVDTSTNLENGVSLFVFYLDASKTDGTVVQTAVGQDLVAGDAPFTFSVAPRANSLVVGFAITADTETGNATPAPTGYTLLSPLYNATWSGRRHMVFYDNTSAAQGPNAINSLGLRSIVCAVEFASSFTAAVAPAKIADCAISPATTPAVDGTVFTVIPGAYTGSPTPVITYQWLYDSTIIPGEINTTFDSTGYTGHYITVKEIATNAVGVATSVSSLVNIINPAFAPSPAVNPSISGSSIEGSTLTRVMGTWNGTPAPSVTGEWYIDGVPTGNTTATIVIAGGNAGKAYSWVDTAINSNGTAVQGSNIIVATVASVGTTFTFGALSLAGHGAVAAPAGATAISGGTATGWTMSSGVVYMIGNGTGTAGTLTFTGSATTWTMSVTANRYTVNTITELLSVMSISTAVLSGKGALLRSGNYQWPTNWPVNTYSADFKIEAADQSAPNKYPVFLLWGAANPSTQPFIYGSHMFFYRCNFYAEWIKGTHSTGADGLQFGGVCGDNRFEDCEIYGNFKAVYDANSSTFTVDLATQVVTHSFAGTLNTGDRIKLAVGAELSDLPSPLVTNPAAGSYYWIKLSATTGKFASSQANALGGTAITLVTEGNGTNEMYQDVGFRSLINAKATHQLNAPITFYNCRIHDCRGLLHPTDNNVNADSNAFDGYVIDSCDLYNYHTDVCQFVGGANQIFDNNKVHDPVGLRSVSHVDVVQALALGYTTLSQTRVPDMKNIRMRNNTVAFCRTDGYRSSRETQCAFFEDIAIPISAATYGMSSFKTSANWSLGGGYSIVGDTLVCGGGTANSKTVYVPTITLSSDTRYCFTTTLLSKANATGDIIFRVKQGATVYATKNITLASTTVGQFIYIDFRAPVSGLTNFTIEIEVVSSLAQFSLGTTDPKSVGCRFVRFSSHVGHTITGNIFYCRGNANVVAIFNGIGCTIANNTLVSDSLLNLGYQDQPKFRTSSVWAPQDLFRASGNTIAYNVAANNSNSFSALLLQSNPVDTLTSNYATDANSAAATANLGAGHDYASIFAAGAGALNGVMTPTQVRSNFSRLVGGPLDTASPKIGA